MWTVILHYNRGRAETWTNLTREEAKNMVDIGVFNNQDCINCSVFKTEKEI